jgi:subtilisin family serine protease
MVAGELLVRFRPDFPACAHCVVAEGQSFTAVTGRRILDQIRARYGIRAMDPVFGGPHSADIRARARQRLGHPNAAAGTATVPDLNQIYLVHVDPKTNLLELAAQLRRDAAVVSAEPNYIYRVADQPSSDAADGEATFPNDPFLASSGSWGQDFPDLWGLFQIGAPAAWERSQGEGVVVAVVDTGIDLEHPDLVANLWHNPGEVPANGIDDDGNGFVDDVDGWDFSRCGLTAFGTCEPKEPGPQVVDRDGHGTHIAGIIGAAGDNGIGVIGVAPRAQVMAIKGLNDLGEGSVRDLAEAILYAAENGAGVINASWGGGPSDTLRLVIEYATHVFDIVVVASAGNENLPFEAGASSPADLPAVLAVGATTHTRERASFSNFGGPLDLVAPGGGDHEPTAADRPGRSILSTWAQDSRLGQVCHSEPGCVGPEQTQCGDLEVCERGPWVIADEYVRNAGTSMAVGYVSGTVALIRNRHPDFTRLQVRQALLQTADDLGSPGWDRYYGYGQLNADRATAVEAIPVAEIRQPDNGGKVRERDLPVGIFGTATGSSAPLASWRLTIRVNDSSSAAQELARGSAAVVHAQLGTLASARPPGRYTLELTVRDIDGHIAQDRKELLVPDHHYVAVPVPNPFAGAGGFNGTIARDGSRLALSAGAPPTRDAEVHLFDLASRRLVTILNAQHPLLAPPNGRYLLYEAFLPANPLGWSLYDFDTGSIQGGFSPFFASTSFPALSANAERFAIASSADLDPSVGNPDESFEVFSIDLPHGAIRQLTNGPKVFTPEVADLAMTPDGRYLVFVAHSDLDPTAPSFEFRRLVVYDFERQSLRQLSRRNPTGPVVGGEPSISDDGRFITYSAGAIFLFDAATEQVTTLVPSDPTFPVRPLISADGRKVAFVAGGDFDPKVTNEDLEPELFLLDLATGAFEQVTDQTHYPFHLSPSMDGAGRSFLATGAGFLNGTSLRPEAVRIHLPRSGPNANPVLVAPSELILHEGQTTTIALNAFDSDGDPLVFFAQRPGTLLSALALFAGATLTDHADGTAELAFSPRYNEAGKYTAVVAVFDEAGGIAEQSIAVTVEDNLIEGDADCNGRLDASDRESLVHVLFDPFLQFDCPLADGNDDGEINAADFVALAVKLLR